MVEDVDVQRRWSYEKPSREREKNNECIQCLHTIINKSAWVPVKTGMSIGTRVV